jgi:hypothetical protein
VEDVTKIWVALNTPYRLSVGYKVTVVQIPSRLQRSFPGLVSELPAGGPRVVVSPIRRPGIDEMYVIRQGDALRRERVAYGRIGDTLVVKGRNLAGEVRLLLDQVDATASITSRRDTRIEATIPDDVSLQPGAVTVRVAAEVLLGDPQVAHRGLSSNLSAFVLIPHARQLKPNLGADPRTLQVLGSRLYAEHKECLTLIGDRVITSTHYTAQHENEIALNLPGDLGAGTYAVRVRVTGAESLDVQNLVIP